MESITLTNEQRSAARMLAAGPNVMPLLPVKTVHQYFWNPAFKAYMENLLPVSPTFGYEDDRRVDVCCGYWRDLYVDDRMWEYADLATPRYVRPFALPDFTSNPDGSVTV